MKWVYDPRAYEIGMPLLAGGFRHRGVAAWRDAQDGNKLRIFLASRYRLFSLDAETGKPVSSFGLDGMVDTSKDLSWPIESSHFEINAAPTIYKDLVILGSAIGDNLLYKKTPPGDVRAYHARTGKLVWRWSSIPQSPTAVGAETWENQSWRDAGQIETWPGVTVDEKRGLVYLPTGKPGQPVLRRSAAGGQPVRRDPDRARRGNRRQALALPARSPRRLGLLVADAGDADGPRGRRPPHRGGHPTHQAWIRLCVRSRHRAAGLADRGAAGAAKRRSRRAQRRTPAVSNAAASSEPAGRHARRCVRPDSGAEGRGPARDAEVPPRAHLHAAEPRGIARPSRPGAARSAGAAVRSIPRRACSTSRRRTASAMLRLRKYDPRHDAKSAGPLRRCTTGSATSS